MFPIISLAIKLLRATNGAAQAWESLYYAAANARCTHQGILCLPGVEPGMLHDNRYIGFYYTAVVRISGNRNGDPDHESGASTWINPVKQNTRTEGNTSLRKAPCTYGCSL